MALVPATVQPSTIAIIGETQATLPVGRNRKIIYTRVAIINIPNNLL